MCDTNIIAELRKRQRANAGVLRWFESVEEEAALRVSVLTLGEIRKGIERVRRSEPAKCRMLEGWLEELESTYSDSILPVSSQVADQWGRWSALRPLPVIDALLAATAKIHGITLVTRNTKDLAGLDCELLNPFD